LPDAHKNVCFTTLSVRRNDPPKLTKGRSQLCNWRRQTSVTHEQRSVLQATRGWLHKQTGWRDGSLSRQHYQYKYQQRRGEGVEPILSEACSQGYPESAICVQKLDDSLNSAIRITYRISLRSSSVREPRYPLLRVVQRFVIISGARRTQLAKSVYLVPNGKRGVPCEDENRRGGGVL
jgi:hypothetical protein